MLGVRAKALASFVRLADSSKGRRAHLIIPADNVGPETDMVFEGESEIDGSAVQTVRTEEVQARRLPADGKSQRSSSDSIRWCCCVSGP